MPYSSQNPRRRHRKKKQQNNTALVVASLGAVLAVLIFLALVMRLLTGGAAPSTVETTVPTQVTEETQPEPTEEKQGFFQRIFGKKEEPEEETLPEETGIHLETTARVSATGDILMHKKVFEVGKQSDGSYRLDPIFQYVKPYIQNADFALANLETTLCGLNNGYPYQGHPQFNCPDEIVDSLKNAGFDMLLTANNHCYDTGEVGFLRTIRTVREKGMQNLGTMLDSSEPVYTIQNVNGIQIGMVCYTYEMTFEGAKADTMYLNGIPVVKGSENLINSFFPGRLEEFYTEISNVLTQMRQQGAEATVVFLHWGEEYQTSANEEQRAIAQRLADLNVDVIVGGHPHVVEPIELLTGSNGTHKTVCLYSMGNAVSNQRRTEMNLKTGHTEDGLVFSMNWEKYSDGSVILAGVDVLPCWVDLRESSTGGEYDIIPLDEAKRDSWQTDYQLSEDSAKEAIASYDRTMAIVGQGLSQVNAYLSSQNQPEEAQPIADAA